MNDYTETELRVRAEHRLGPRKSREAGVDEAVSTHEWEQQFGEAVQVRAMIIMG
ncbi:MAG: hypothetical protein GY801_37945 [bacterium]|nr:hypothetical protein [bacterium]